MEKDRYYETYPLEDPHGRSFIRTDAFLFSAFAGYMFTCERISVSQLEQTHQYSTLTDFTSELRQDDGAPVGVIKVYRGVLDPELSQESCFCFNISHHNIEVFF